jgi:hypothetical protein
MLGFTLQVLNIALLVALVVVLWVLVAAVVVVGAGS